MSAPVLMRPMTAGDILDNAIFLYRKQFAALFGVVAILSAPLLAANVLLVALTPSFGSVLGTAAPFSSSQLSQQMITSSLSGLVSILQAIAAMVQTAALTWAFSEAFNGRALTIKQAYQAIPRHLANLIVGGIAYYVASAVIGACSVFLCFVPMLVIVPRWMFVFQGIMLEDLDGVEAMRRSWRMTERRLRRVLGILIAMGLLTYLIVAGPTYLAFGLAGGLAGFGQLAAIMPLATAISGLLQMIYFPITIGATTIFYYDMRIRQEGLDLLWLANEIAPAPAA